MQLRKVKCDQCGFEITANQFNRHYKSCNGLGPKSARIKNKPRVAWNKGIKTPEDVRMKISESLKGRGFGRAASTEAEEERKRKISETMKRKKLGGRREGSGRGKKGRYKGIWCDSSWELAWVIYHLDHNIEFERNWEKFEYKWKNESHYYIPDFKIKEKYIEVKGYMTEQAKAKKNQFPKKLTILKKKEMIPILEYVTNKYGDDFISLYD